MLKVKDGIPLEELGKRTENLLNKKFGRLTVIKFKEINKNKKAVWYCQCECGKIIETTTHNLKSKNTTSCGCSRTKYKDLNRRLYKIWSGVKTRCFNKNRKGYKNYGGRGITICNEWLEYKNFCDWAMANGYKDNLTIERINVNGNYEPANCTWITIQEQQKNKRNTIRLQQVL